MSEQLTADQLEARGLIPRNASPGLKKELEGAIAPFGKAIASGTFRMTEVDKHIPGVYRMEETPENKALRHNMMKAVLRDRFGAERLSTGSTFKKGFIGVSA